MLFREVPALAKVRSRLARARKDFFSLSAAYNATTSHSDRASEQNEYSGHGG